MFQSCLRPYKTLIKTDLFFRDAGFHVSVTSMFLGETSPLPFPYRNGLLQLEQAGESLFSSLTSPREGGHFLRTVSLLTSGRPPGINRGSAELGTLPGPFAGSLP